MYRKYDAIVKSGIPILKRYDIPGRRLVRFVLSIAPLTIVLTNLRTLDPARFPSGNRCQDRSWLFHKWKADQRSRSRQNSG